MSFLSSLIVLTLLTLTYGQKFDDYFDFEDVQTNKPPQVTYQPSEMPKLPTSTTQSTTLSSTTPQPKTTSSTTTSIPSTTTSIPPRQLQPTGQQLQPTGQQPQHLYKFATVMTFYKKFQEALKK